ncbi:hypothetical protein PINS_up016544 [Pythium insidiosum]|nr:hypothetical protein PINS_up016544 [Pythium insidiosum]
MAVDDDNDEQLTAIAVDAGRPLCPSASPVDASTAAAVDPQRNRFPFCIVWSPLPVITWFLPFIGHMGIATSEGIIYDFAGPYTIGREHLAFGAPTRYLQCRVPRERVEKWDEGVRRGCAIYETRMHNLCCDNCHSHVATCLDLMQYQGSTRWNMVTLCFWMFFCGRYVGVAGVVKSWAPSLLVAAVIYIAVSM